MAEVTTIWRRKEGKEEEYEKNILVRDLMDLLYVSQDIRIQQKNKIDDTYVLQLFEGTCLELGGLVKNKHLLDLKVVRMFVDDEGYLVLAYY